MWRAAWAASCPSPPSSGWSGYKDAASNQIVAEHFGEGFDLEAWVKAVRAHSHEQMAAGIALKAGVVEILDFLDTTGLPRAIATSSSLASVQRNLKRAGSSTASPP